MVVPALPMMGQHHERLGSAMIDQDKSKQELIEELAEMRRRVAVLETTDTEHKQAEQASQESEERFRKVFEEGPIGILLVGTDGSIRHANQHFCEMLGYSENEIIALGLAGISHPDDGEGSPLRFTPLAWEISYSTRRNAIFIKMARWCGLN